MIVYFIRHGQTDGNKLKIHQGWEDICLNATGCRQIECTRKIIENIKFNRIFCSDLLRTRQSAGILFGNGIEDTEVEGIEYLPLLREINNTCFSGQKRSDLRAKYGEEYINNIRRLDYSPYGGESDVHLRSRVKEFLDLLCDIPDSWQTENICSLSEEPEETKIAVVTHGGFLLALISHLFGNNPSTVTASMSNGGISVLTRRYEKKTGNDKYGWTIEQWNYLPLLIVK